MAIKNVQSFILQNHRDLSGGEKLTKIVIERIEKSEEYFQDTTTDEQREFAIKKFSNLSRTMEDEVTLTIMIHLNLGIEISKEKLKCILKV